MKQFARRSIAKDSVAAKMLSNLADAIRQMQVGKPVIVLDAEHREGKGDFAIAAQFCTPDCVNFLLANLNSQIDSLLPLRDQTVHSSTM